MRIWLLGKDGMLGRSLCEELTKRGIEFIATGSDVDITSKKELSSFLEKKGRGITHIINATAYSNVERSEEEKDLSYGVNGHGLINLSEIANTINAKLIHFSTDYIFSGDKNSPYLEKDLAQPLSTYGYGKLLGEKNVLSVARKKLLIRTSWLFGCGYNNKKKSNGDFVLKIINKIKTEKEIKVVSDQIGRPTYCQDLAEMTLNILDEEGIFHICNDTIMSWYDFAIAIYEKVKKSKGLNFLCEKIIPVNSNMFVTKAKRPQYSVLDTIKIEKILNRKMPSFDKALEKYMVEILCQEK